MGCISISTKARLALSTWLTMYLVSLIVFAAVPFEEGENVIRFPEWIAIFLSLAAIACIWIKFLVKKMCVSDLGYLFVGFIGIATGILYTAFSGHSAVITIPISLFVFAGVVGAVAGYYFEKTLE